MAKVGDVIEADNAAWSFAGDTPRHFDGHVRRSVPGYDAGHALVTAISDFVIGPGSRCYDLGCATGGLTAALAARHAERGAQVIGVDIEPDMIAAARQAHTDSRAEFTCADLCDYEFESCDLIVAYYTLQFVRPRARQQVFDRLFAALNWGGALILFEKVRAPDARFQDMMTALYTDHKLEAGYDGDEIIAKSRALKGILEPFSTAGNLGLMQRAGFVDIMTVYKNVCFEGFLAIK